MAPQKTYGFELTLTGLTALTAAILVDLSDTTNFKHAQTGRINVYDLHIELIDDGTWDGVFEIGYLENVDATNGDFVPMYRITNGAAGTVKADLQFHKYPLLCHSDYYATDGKTVDSTLFQTDVLIASSIDRLDTPYTTASGNGDLAVLTTRPAAGTVGWKVIGRYGTVANV